MCSSSSSPTCMAHTGTLLSCVHLGSRHPARVPPVWRAPECPGPCPLPLPSHQGVQAQRTLGPLDTCLLQLYPFCQGDPCVESPGCICFCSCCPIRATWCSGPKDSKPKPVRAPASQPTKATRYMQSTHGMFLYKAIPSRLQEVVVLPDS